MRGIMWSGGPSGHPSIVHHFVPPLFVNTYFALRDVSVHKGDIIPRCIVIRSRAISMTKMSVCPPVCQTHEL